MFLLIIFFSTLGEEISFYYAKPYKTEKAGYLFTPLYKVLQLIVTMYFFI